MAKPSESISPTNRATLCDQPLRLLLPCSLVYSDVFLITEKARLKIDRSFVHSYYQLVYYNQIEGLAGMLQRGTFADFRYMRGLGFYELKDMKG